MERPRHKIAHEAISRIQESNSNKFAHRLVDGSDNASEDNGTDDPPLTKHGGKPNTTDSHFDPQSASLLFPSLFYNDLNPTALPYPTPSRQPRSKYGEGVNGALEGFIITRPTIKLPLDDILDGVDNSDDSDTHRHLPSPRITPRFSRTTITTSHKLPFSRT